MKRTLLVSTLLLTFLLGQTQTTKFTSSNYKYTIELPQGYERKSAKGIHIDIKVVNKDGSSILVNISKRVPEEKGIDAHDYSKEYFKTIFAQTDPKTIISKTEKIIIDKKKAFLIYYTYPSGTGGSLKVIEAYIFVGDNAYVITTTAGSENFNEHENTFLETIKSIKFQ